MWREEWRDALALSRSRGLQVGQNELGLGNKPMPVIDCWFLFQLS